MQHRDLLKDQIEQLGKVLAKILAHFLGKSTPADFSTRMDTVSEQLQSELDIELAELLERDKEDLKKYLSDRNLNGDHLDTMSKLLETMGVQQLDTNREEGLKYLQRALVLISLSDEVSNTLSFDKINRQSRIENLFKQEE